jgi:hypothetical protein
VDVQHQPEGVVAGFAVAVVEVGSLVDGACHLIGTEAGVIDGQWVNRIHPIFRQENRDLNEHRADEYAGAMAAGEWWFTPVPIVFSTDGYVLNGQHRLVALLTLLKSDHWRAESFRSGRTIRAGMNEPMPRNAEREPIQFVVVTGVERRAALLMDEARRTANDRRKIGMKFAA